MAAWIIMILGLLYISVGMLCLFVPKYLRNWINKRSTIELRVFGVLISLTGALLIMQLLAFSRLFNLLIALTETTK